MCHVDQAASAIQDWNEAAAWVQVALRRFAWLSGEVPQALTGMHAFSSGQKFDSSREDVWLCCAACCLVTVAQPCERVALLMLLECVMVWSPCSDEGCVTAQQQRWRPHRRQHCNLHLLL